MGTEFLGADGTGSSETQGGSMAQDSRKWNASTVLNLF